MTFFEEHFDCINEHATNWAYNIAKFTRDYDAVPDYRQEFLLYIWNYCNEYDPARGVPPKMFIIKLCQWARGQIFDGMNTKREQFWASMLKLEDLSMGKRPWEEWVYSII